MWHSRCTPRARAGTGMATTMKTILAAAALITVATPLLGAPVALAAPAAPACKNGIVVNSYPPKTCKPKLPKPIGGNGGGGIIAGGGGGGVIAGNGGGNVGGGGTLPFTGADILAMSVGGGVLVAVGGGAIVAGRRRRSAQVA